jgi:hypothetical protein
VLILYVIGTGQDSKYLSLEDRHVPAQGETEPSANRLPIDSSPGPPPILDPSVNQTSPLTAEGTPVPFVQASLVSNVTPYLGSKLKTGLIVSTPMLNMVSHC